MRRVLGQKFRLGLFENPSVDVGHAVQAIHSPANPELALRAGRKGIVLLKNDKNVLPLKKNMRSVAVIGPDAENLLNQLGDYSPHVISQHIVTILEGIKAKVGPETRVVAVKGCKVKGNDKWGLAEATRVAKSADVAIVAVGENQGQNDVAEDHDRPIEKVMTSRAWISVASRKI
jgi:beta-glucosidase